MKNILTLNVNFRLKLASSAIIIVQLIIKRILLKFELVSKLKPLKLNQTKVINHYYLRYLLNYLLPTTIQGLSMVSIILTIN